MQRMAALAVLLVTACGPTSQDTGWVKPPTVTVTCDEWAAVPHGNALYFNNVWNVQAAGDFAWRQCIERDPEDADRLGFSWHWPNYGNDIYSQPQAKIGASPWAPEPNLDPRFPARIGDIASMTVATERTLDAVGEYNLVTTLWLTDTGEIGSDPKPQSIIAEVMIWTYRTPGLVNPAGAMIGTVEQRGQTWEIWLEEDWGDVSGENDNRWIYLAFVATEPGLSATFDPVALLRSEQLERLGFERAWIADVELGAEIMRGDGLMWIDRFEVEIEPK